MADYFSPSVVTPSIPRGDMTPIEHLLLTAMFQSEPDGDALYLFAEASFNDRPILDVDEIRAALDDGEACRTADFVRANLADVACDEAILHLEDELPWEQALQDIVRRSQTLANIQVITAFTCTKMRPDGFGGAITLITADQIQSSSTDQMALEMLDRAEWGEVACAPGVGSHILLRLSETHVRRTVEVIFDTEAPAGLGLADVTDADIRQASLDVKAARDLSHEAADAALHAAIGAIRLAAERTRPAQ